jgi:hypothetical protein
MVTDSRSRDANENPDVQSYKQFLAEIIEQRPSGTRQRLATALAKNRSFVSQITSPAYAVPVPANHLDVIFEVCRFSAGEKKAFLEIYNRAHPNRLALVQSDRKLKPHTFYLPDLEDDELNQQLHTLVTDFVRQVATLANSSRKGGRRG